MDRVSEFNLTRLVKLDLDHIALGGCDHDAVDPLLTLELADVGSHDLCTRAPKHHVERSGIRHVGDIEPNDLTAVNFQVIVGRPIDKHHVPEPPHEGMTRRRIAPRDRPLPVHEDVVENDHFFPVHAAVVVNLGWRNQHVAVKTEVLLKVLPHVWVVPVDTGIAEIEFIGERLADKHRCLCDIGHAVKPVVEPQAVPVHGCRHLDLVGEIHGDRRAALGLDERPWMLAVVAVHQKRLVVNRAADDRRHKVKCFTVDHLNNFARARLRKSTWVHIVLDHERPDDRHGTLNARQRRHQRVHRWHSPRDVAVAKNLSWPHVHVAHLILGYHLACLFHLL